MAAAWFGLFEGGWGPLGFAAGGEVTEGSGGSCWCGSSCLHFDPADLSPGALPPYLTCQSPENERRICVCPH